jgi:hypothetical protein
MLVEPTSRACARHFPFGDQITGVAGQAIREKQEVVVGNGLRSFLDGLYLAGCHRPPQAARYEGRLSDCGHEIPGRPALVVSSSPDGEAIEADEAIGVGIFRGAAWGRGQLVLLSERAV